MRPRRLAPALAFAIFTACGGGGGGSSDSSSTSISHGEIATLGSAVVAGTIWNTDSAQVVIDGVGAVVGDLRTGMVATVQGARDSSTTGTASQVDVLRAAEGPIESIVDLDADRAELEVAARSVAVERGVTLFDGFGFDTMAEGDLVEVWGFADEDGAIRATRIEKLGAYGGGMVAVTIGGAVENLIPGGGSGGSFEIGPVTVFYQDEDLLGVPNGEAGLAGEPFVLVDGVFDPVTDELQATLVQIEGGFVGDIDDVEIEGIVSGFTDFTRPFEVGRQVVTGSAFGEFEPPDLDDFFANGMLVEVEGRLLNGTLQAETVKLRDAEVRIAAQIAMPGDVNVAAGTIVLLGITAQVDASTRLEGGLTLADLMSGDYLEVHGIEMGTSVLATSIQRGPVGDVKLGGRVGAFNGGVPLAFFAIAGSQVPTGVATTFEDFPVVVANQTGFYNFLIANPGIRVLAVDLQGDGSESAFDVADRVEFRDEQ